MNTVNSTQKPDKRETWGAIATLAIFISLCILVIAFFGHLYVG